MQPRFPESTYTDINHLLADLPDGDMTVTAKNTNDQVGIEAVD